MNRRSAFTLIEILVVIAVIATLMGLLLSVINTNQADIAATMSKIQQVAGSAELYKTKNGSYPLTQVPAAEFSDTVLKTIASRNHELRARLVAISAEYDVGGEHFFKTSIDYDKPSPARLATVPDTCDCIVDLWNNPLVYKPFTAYLAPPSTWPGGERWLPPKPNSFQIWSAGPDFVYQMNSANADLSSGERFETDPDKLDDSSTLVIYDDITNWTRVQN